MQKRHFNLEIAAILSLACLIRLLGIASRPIWYDEAFSILFSEKGLGAMLYGTLAPTGAGSADIHPLGYYTILWLWIRAFGASLIATRLLSVLAGLFTVYLVYLVALERLSDTRVAYLSAFFASLAPFLVHYAQEIRMYSFLAMWLLLATYAYQRGSRTDSWKWWVIFSVTAALAQYTHNLAAFYLVALALLPVLQGNWRASTKLIAAGMAALALYLPWGLHLPAQFSKIQAAYWVERPDVSEWFTLLLVYITNTPLPARLIPAALAGVLIIVSIGIIQTIRHTRQAAAKEGLWLFYLSFAPPLFLFLFSQWRPVYIERALLPSGAIFCIWLAWVITQTHLPNPARYSLFGLLAIASIIGNYQHIMYRDFPYGPFRELDSSLSQRLEPEDAIVHSNKMSMLPALLFDRSLPQEFIGDEPGSPSDTLAPATQDVLNIRAETGIQSAAEESERIWYIVYQRAIDEYQAGGYRTHPDLEYLSSHYELEAEETWDGLRVFLYSRAP